MERAIKLRAWSPKKKEMIYLFAGYGCGVNIESNGEYWEIFKERSRKGAYMNGMFGDILMQWIGLNDANNKHIYEGDIVKCTDAINQIEFTASVEFGNPNGRYDWGYQLNHISGDKPNMDILLWVESEIEYISCEVIGNIYENPELLEVKA